MNKKRDELFDTLMAAVDEADTGRVVELLEKGVPPNGQDDGAQSPLILAADSGYHEICGILLRFGADVNYEDDAGDTPLICASVIGSVRIVRSCIEAGADLDKENRFGLTALGYALHRRHKEVSEILRSYGAKVAS